MAAVLPRTECVKCFLKIFVFLKRYTGTVSTFHKSYQREIWEKRVISPFRVFQLFDIWQMPGKHSKIFYDLKICNNQSRAIYYDVSSNPNSLQLRLKAVLNLRDYLLRYGGLF